VSRHPASRDAYAWIFAPILATPAHGLVDQRCPTSLAFRTSSQPSFPRPHLAFSQQSAKMSTFEESLQHLDRLLDDVTDEILQTHQNLIEIVCKKLNKSKRSSASSLIDALAKSQRKIQEYVEQSVADALKCPVDWDEVDLRIHDIRLGINQQDMKTKFRKGLAERALASQFCEWEMVNFGRSKLGDLLQNPGTGKEKNNNGNMVKFIEANELPVTEYVKKGIQLGTKLLLLESQVGTPGCSVVLFFDSGKFRAVKNAEVEELAKSMQETVWISELIERVETWFQDCLTAYNG
jgi:hypothetical protein